METMLGSFLVGSGTQHGGLLLMLFFFFSFGGTCSLNLGLYACKAGALPPEPHLQSILLWLFWR
jgi:hypothetical protein